MEGDMEDDDMVVVIIGDKVPSEEVTIKQEPLDETEIAPVEEILETAVKHGEFIDVKKEFEDIEDVEEYDEYEALEEEDDEDDPDYGVELPKKRKSKPQQDRKEKPERKTKRRCERQTRIFGPRPDWKQHVPVSHVQKLRDQNPDFIKNPSKLVDHLSEIMRKLRPPKLPPDVVTIKYDGNVVTYVCCVCEVEMDSIAAGHRHYQRFHGERYLTCYACGVTFTNTPNLYKHEKNCKSRDAAIVLKARGLYLGVKGRGRPFCTDKSFRPGDNPLPKHKGRYYCSQCPGSFAHKDAMVAHELMHAGLRPFRCPHCPAAYTSDVALKRHLQTHGEDKFICDDCGRGFKLKPLIVSHMNVHQPFRKHPCPHCPQRYARRISLRNHINNKHLNLPHEHGCPVCPKRYARISHVRDHMKKAHGLAMITRSMFFQSLPTMSNITLAEAKIVLKNKAADTILLPEVTVKKEKHQQEEQHQQEEEYQLEEQHQQEEEYQLEEQHQQEREYQLEEQHQQEEEYQLEEQHQQEEEYQLEEQEEGEETITPDLIVETDEVEVEYESEKSTQHTLKKVYQIQSDSKHKIEYELSMKEDEEDLDDFLRLIQNAKPGTKVRTVQKTKPKTQYLNPPDLLECNIPYQPKVKVHSNYFRR